MLALDTPAYATRAMPFETQPLTRAIIEDLMCNSDDGDPLKAAFVAAIEHVAARGLPWSAGSRRIVFLAGSVVIKLPFTMGGVTASGFERRGFCRTLAGTAYCPTAACRLLHNADGIPILIMRTVRPTKGGQTLPDWTLSVDCGQVGLDPRGRLVAYDL